MSTVMLAVRENQKRRKRSPRLFPVTRPAHIIIGHLVGIQGDSGSVVAETSHDMLEMFTVDLSEGRGNWFRQLLDRSICLDSVEHFPRAHANEGDLFAFERPLDPLDRVLRWGFGVNLATEMVCQCRDEEDLLELFDRVPEFRPLLVDEDGEYVLEGPSEAWNEILTNRMYRTFVPAR